MDIMFIKMYLRHQLEKNLLLNVVERQISVEVIGRWRCGRMEVPWQFEFNSSNKVNMKLLKELLANKSRV